MLQEVYRFSFWGHQFPVYGYGLMLVIAFLACVASGKRLARHCGIDPELVVNAALIALVSGLIGARLCHVLENLPEFTRGDLSIWQRLRMVADVGGGGLTFYGGFLLATPCCIVYAKMNRVPIRLGMDLIAPVLMIGLGLGRIGCFLNGCCYGQQCNSALGVRFPYYSIAYLDQYSRRQIEAPAELTHEGMGVQALVAPDSAEFEKSAADHAAAREARALPVLPTQLYSAFTAFLLAGLLLAYFTLPHVDGRVFAMMLVLEGIARFVLEMVRVEPVVWPQAGASTGLSISMMLGMVNVVVGMGMWWGVGRMANATLCNRMQHFSNNN